MNHMNQHRPHTGHRFGLRPALLVATCLLITGCTTDTTPTPSPSPKTSNAATPQTQPTQQDKPTEPTEEPTEPTEEPTASTPGEPVGEPQDTKTANTKTADTEAADTTPDPTTDLMLDLNLQGWSVLNQSFTQYHHAVMTGDAQDPQDSPNDITGGFTFTDGVTLANWAPETGWCLTGPHQTYLNVSAKKNTLTRAFGTGPCHPRNGVVVMTGTITDKGDLPVYTEHATKGADLAPRIKGIHQFATSTNSVLRAFAAMSPTN